MSTAGQQSNPSKSPLAISAIGSKRSSASSSWRDLRRSLGSRNRRADRDYSRKNLHAAGGDFRQLSPVLNRTAGCSPICWKPWSAPRLTLNLPMDLKIIPLIDALRARLRAHAADQGQGGRDRAVFENIERGDQVDLIKFPVPRWHAGDGGRYLGTAHLVVTRDPETGVENVGCYRVMLQDKDKVGLYISPGKHGKMHYEKAMKAGKTFPVAMAFGQHPLLYIAASQAVPFGVNEYDWAGGLIGQPIEVIEGTGDRSTFSRQRRKSSSKARSFPAKCMQEGPFGEWPGYYASARRAEPFVRVKALYYRNDPIICGAAPFKPTIHGMYRSCLRAATVWNGMEQAGVPDIKGVYLPPPAQRFMIVVAINQRYPGHAKQAALVASPVPCGGLPRALRGRRRRRHRYHQHQ